METLSLESGLGFATHSHPQDQLSWMRSGAMTVSVDGVTLWLRRDHLVWIPGHARHDMTIIEGGEVVSLYTSSDLRPGRRPLGPRPCPLVRAAAGGDPGPSDGQSPCRYPRSSGCPCSPCSWPTTGSASH